MPQVVFSREILGWCHEWISFLLPVDASHLDRSFAVFQWRFWFAALPSCTHVSRENSPGSDIVRIGRLTDLSRFNGSWSVAPRCSVANHLQEWSLRLNSTQHRKNSPGPDTVRIDRLIDCSFLFLRVVLHGRSQLVDRFAWLIILTKETVV